MNSARAPGRIYLLTAGVVLIILGGWMVFNWLNGVEMLSQAADLTGEAVPGWLVLLQFILLGVAIFIVIAGILGVMRSAETGPESGSKALVRCGILALVLLAVFNGYIIYATHDIIVGMYGNMGTLREMRGWGDEFARELHSEFVWLVVMSIVEVGVAIGYLIGAKKNLNVAEEAPTGAVSPAESAVWCVSCGKAIGSYYKRTCPNCNTDNSPAGLERIKQKKAVASAQQSRREELLKAIETCKASIQATKNNPSATPELDEARIKANAEKIAQLEIELSSIPFLEAGQEIASHADIAPPKSLEEHKGEEYSTDKDVVCVNCDEIIKSHHSKVCSNCFTDNSPDGVTLFEKEAIESEIARLEIELSKLP